MSCYMSDDEIVAIYRQAEDRKKQIKILADLNATSKEVISSILMRAGVLEEVKPVKKPSSQQLEYTTPNEEKIVKNRCGGRGKRMTPERHQQLLDLYNDGLGDKAIAKKVGLASPSSVCLWRKKHGLPANHERGGNRRSEQ